MPFSLRSWLFAITILLLAEDFQYLLKVGVSAFGQTPTEMIADFDGREENEEGNEEKQEEKEEKKEEKKEKDDDNKLYPDDLLHINFQLTKHKFTDAFALLSSTTHELEGPPPEV
ncbi:MAG: hypothetical protein DYG98_13900 [Haliscomenobacteraceae bacterium CHB4]|nr:hypothetical protein [Saprospiraceae bacterium]MCE7924141.1 hypothetical protein [Haliscomenobacteraceae bacterium CHB4]